MFSGKDVGANNMVLWYCLNRGNLEVYSYHGEYAEVSARSL